jgi:hypothetical protein
MECERKALAIWLFPQEERAIPAEAHAFHTTAAGEDDAGAGGCVGKSARRIGGTVHGHTAGGRKEDTAGGSWFRSVSGRSTPPVPRGPVCLFSTRAAARGLPRPRARPSEIPRPTSRRPPPPPPLPLRSRIPVRSADPMPGRAFTLLLLALAVSAPLLAYAAAGDQVSAPPFSAPHTPSLPRARPSSSPLTLGFVFLSPGRGGWRRR